MREKFLILIAILLSSCNELTSIKNDKLVSRVGENYLYESEIPDFSLYEDSLIRKKVFIDSWAREKILFDLSLVNLDQNSIINLDELIERYKRDLYINSYKDILINSMVDSIISDSEIDEYYDKNLNKFKLNEDLIKFRFVKIPLDNINLNKIRNGLIRYSSFDMELIDSLSFQLASYNLNDSLWITKRDFFNQVDFVNYENQKKYVKKGQLISKRDSMYVNLLFIDDILQANSVAPRSYLSDRIKSTIYNNRKILLIRELNKEIINDAIKSKKYELYK
mgnify:FL=1|tara:strand:- start:45 stop:881 length:837 start_codon:yes stop_codon:yes gene_type:complete